MPMLDVKIYQSNENTIKKVSDKTIFNWNQIIRKDREMSKTIIDIIKTRYNVKDNNFIGMLQTIYKKMAIEKKLLDLIKETYIRNNLQAYVLCNIIEKC